MKSKVIVPATLLPKLEELGFNPSEGTISYQELLSILQRQKSDVPNQVRQWASAALAKQGVDTSKFISIIDALVFPYGGHNEGRDCAGEFFHAGTDFMEEYLPFPPIINAHGYDTDGKGASETTVVGESLRRWRSEEGCWMSIGIYKDTPYTEEIITAWQKGTLRFSSTALLKQIDPATKGKIDVWLAGEASTILPSSGMQACNLLAAPASQKSHAEVMALVESQPEPYRTRLLELIRTAHEQLEVPLGVEDNPVNPDDEPDENESAVDFKPNEDNMPFTDEQKKELNQMIVDSVAAAMTQVQEASKAAAASANTSTPPNTDSQADDDGRQKSDIASFLSKRTAAVRTNGLTNKAATEFVDAYITAGKLNPELREQTVLTVTAAIQADERQKSGTASLEAVAALLDAGGFGFNPNDARRAHGFKPDPNSLKDEPNEEDVKAMVGALGVA